MISDYLVHRKTKLFKNVMNEINIYQIIRELGNFASEMAEVKTLQELANSVEKILELIIPTEYTGLYLYDPKIKKLKLLFAKGFTEEEKRIAEETAMERHPGKIFKEKIILNIPDVENDINNFTSDSPRSFVVKSRLYLPVMNKNECVGTFGITSVIKNRFSETDIEMLRFVCQLAGVVYSSIITEEERISVFKELKMKDKAISSSNNGIIITDATLPDNPLIFANPAFYRITGYDPEDVLGKNCRFLQGSDRDQKVLNELREAIHQKKPCTVKLRNYKKDGSLFWNELMISPIFDDDGNVVNFLGIQNDITPSVSSEEKLKESSARLSELIQNITSGILVEDENRRIVIANHLFCEIFGIPVDPILLIGVDCSNAAEQSKHLLKDPEIFVARIVELLKEKKLVKNEEIIFENGRTFERDYVPIFITGEYKGHLWNYREITERKNIEIELNELKAFYEETLSDLSGQVAVFDSNFRYLYVNPMSVSNPEIRQWIIGKDDYEYCEFRGIEKSVADLRRKWLLEAKQQKQQIRFEEEFKRVDGTTRFFERKISPIIDSNNEVTRYVAYGVDITEIKSLVKKLEYSNKSLMDFAYIASHDLREPLRKISTFGSLLNKSLDGKLDEDSKENLDYMIDGAKRMQQMIDDLLYYSRITEKAKNYSLINLDDLVSEIINFDLSEMIEDNEAKIIFENELGTFKGEKTQIKQLFQNLIANGIKYRKKNISPLVNITSRRIYFGIEIKIEDNGIGIEEKYLDQIFEMFKRLHSKGEYEGSGIGLAVCKKIVELYNGEIEVSSEPGIGSTFIFTLPIME